MNLRNAIVLALTWAGLLSSELLSQDYSVTGSPLQASKTYTTMGQTRGPVVSKPVARQRRAVSGSHQVVRWADEDLPLPPTQGAAKERAASPPAASHPPVAMEEPNLDDYIVDDYMVEDGMVSDAGFIQNHGAWQTAPVFPHLFRHGHGHGHFSAPGGPYRLPRGLYGEFLYLRPGNDKVSFAVPVDGAITSSSVAPVQIGDEATVDADFSSGFRVGGDVMLNPVLSLGVSYTQFDADDESRVSTRSPFVLRSIVSHPGTRTTSRDFLEARAQQDIQFDLVDIILTREWLAGTDHLVAWQLGPRFGGLEQQFQSTMTSSTLIETVTTDVDFDGGGLAFGLIGVRRISGIGACSCAQCSRQHGWSLYGKALASVLGGRMHASYLQADNFTRDAIVRTGWEDDRLVPTLDVEFGFNWISASDRLRLSAGYLFSAWYNVVTTDEFIDGVRRNASTSISDTITFDGLTASAEWRF